MNLYTAHEQNQIHESMTEKLFSFESHPIIQPSALGWLGATSHPLVSGLVIGCHRVLKAHMLHILHIHWKGCGCSDLE